MRNAGITIGDIQVVDKVRQARPEDAVVVVIGAEFVVKRLAVDGERRPRCWLRTRRIS